MLDSVLLVEDSCEDCAFVLRALAKVAAPHTLQTVTDGRQAVEYLSGEGKFADRAAYPLPRVILLDLNLLAVPEFELLRWIRSQPGLRNPIVVVLTAPVRLAVFRRAYALGASSCSTKPSSGSELEEMVRNIGDFWLKEDGPLEGKTEAEIARHCPAMAQV